MRFLVPILFVLIISCNGNTQKHPSDKKTLDSTSVAYRKYCDSLYNLKVNEFRRLKKQIPFSEDYYTWFEITFSNKILNDLGNEEYHSIRIGQPTSWDLMLHNDCYGDSNGSYYIINTTSGKDGVLFETISQEQKDTVFWKLKFLSADSSSGEWSFKKTADKKFNSLSTFMPEKYMKKTDL